MGCITSKRAFSPNFHSSGEFPLDRNGPISGPLFPSIGGPGSISMKSEESVWVVSDLGKFGKECLSEKGSISLRFGSFNMPMDSEEAVLGWPTWLTNAASEAIQGWVPLRPHLFKKLEKIGQGTYSCVYRARNVETGKMFALKKVRFDKFQPESVKFMSREIKILRKLDHPNVMKLEGIITSRLSSSIYLVFEYMEHDLTGLLSSPDIKFSDAQIKCYMQQLLYGIEHCHSRGIMHRDIKASNILVNNQGVLKMADFGLANLFGSKQKRPLTSRVVTLWYRPPELILGSTNYGAYVDLWSVGCVFAELLSGKPILKGRNEVEQLHKIFKLCGSPDEKYWKRSKLPLATMFKPQCPYESSLRERCKEFSVDAVNLIETLLSIEPLKRGTAISALQSKCFHYCLFQYFLTEPYACEASSLPKYVPNKEIDAKSREQALRKKADLIVQESVWRKQNRVPMQESSLVNKFTPSKEAHGYNKYGNRHNAKNRRGAQFRELHTSSEVSQLTDVSQGDIEFSNPLQIPTSNGFSGAKSRNENLTIMRSYSRPSLSSQTSFDRPSVHHSNYVVNLETKRSEDNSRGVHAKHPRTRTRFVRPISFDVSDVYHSRDMSNALYEKDGSWRNGNLVDESNGRSTESSGSHSAHSRRMDEFIVQRQEAYIRPAIQKSRMHY